MGLGWIGQYLGGVGRRGGAGAGADHSPSEPWDWNCGVQ